MMSSNAARVGRGGCLTRFRSTFVVIVTLLAPLGFVDVARSATTLYRSEPVIISVALVPPGIDEGAITDVKVADFNGDGDNDLAVLWYLTDFQNMAANQRALTIYENLDDTLQPSAEFNLYVPDYNWPTYSIFLDGTAALGTGDYDGDGDIDLVASAFFGDELYFFENSGDGTFQPYLRHRFGDQSAPWLVTIPEIHAADFNGDGADEIVYISDPSSHPDGWPIHFWTTNESIADLGRVIWRDRFGEPAMCYWRRAMAVDDFDLDGVPDIVVTGTDSAAELFGMLQTWYGFDPTYRSFWVSNLYPDFVSADVVAVRVTEGSRPGLILTDEDGTRMQYWQSDAGVDFTLRAEEHGYAATAPGRGMVAAVADVDGDGDQDLVTRQLVSTDGAPNQIEITLSSNDGADWQRVEPTPINTAGLIAGPDLAHLRPRSLAVADVLGSYLPEIVAGFAFQASGEIETAPPNDGQLELAIWQNGCIGDINQDGLTNGADLTLFRQLADEGETGYFAAADLNQDGILDDEDALLLLMDFGCGCDDCGPIIAADMNCDGHVNHLDVDPFAIAISGCKGYDGCYPNCNWLNGDLTGDLNVSYRDIDPFVYVLSVWAGAKTTAPVK